MGLLESSILQPKQTVNFGCKNGMKFASSFAKDVMVGTCNAVNNEYTLDESDSCVTCESKIEQNSIEIFHPKNCIFLASTCPVIEQKNPTQTEAMGSITLVRPGAEYPGVCLGQNFKGEETDLPELPNCAGWKAMTDFEYKKADDGYFYTSLFLYPPTPNVDTYAVLSLTFAQDILYNYVEVNTGYVSCTVFS